MDCAIRTSSATRPNPRGSTRSCRRGPDSRAVAEISRQHAARELGSGLFIGSLLLSLTIGVPAALGVYRVTGNNGWTALWATVPGFILAAVLVHFAWNFTQGGVFSAAVSGGKTSGFLQGHMAGPTWLTGGAFGAEGSLVALVVCIVAGLLLLIAATRRNHVIQPFWSASSRQVA
jgi:hypothetical protein